MHIGAVMVFEATENGPPSIGELRSQIEDRVDLLPYSSLPPLARAHRRAQLAPLGGRSELRDREPRTPGRPAGSRRSPRARRMGRRVLVEPTRARLPALGRGAPQRTGRRRGGSLHRRPTMPSSDGIGSITSDTSFSMRPARPCREAHAPAAGGTQGLSGRPRWCAKWSRWPPAACAWEPTSPSTWQSSRDAFSAQSRGRAARPRRDRRRPQHRLNVPLGAAGAPTSLPLAATSSRRS